MDISDSDWFPQSYTVSCGFNTRFQLVPADGCTLNYNFAKLKIFLVLSFVLNIFYLEVSFDVNADGILTVSATDKSTGKENKLTIEKDSCRLSNQDIDRMVSECQ